MLLMLFRPRRSSGAPAAVVTGRFDQPTPTGGMDPGSPSSASYDTPSPG